MVKGTKSKLLSWCFVATDSQIISGILRFPINSLKRNLLIIRESAAFVFAVRYLRKIYHSNATALIMRRHFLDLLATAFGGQAVDTIIKQPAGSFQAINLLLLPDDYPVQRLQQVFLISGFYFQLYYSIIIHAGI